MSENRIPNRLDWEFDSSSFGDLNFAKSKRKLFDASLRYRFSQTQKMFKWTGLPDTIKQRDIELLLQRKGKAFLVRVPAGENMDGTKREEGIYALDCSFTGLHNQNDFPTKVLIVEPYLHLEGIYRIDVDGVLVMNDPLMLGLLPLASIKSAHFAETNLTLRLASILARSPIIPKGSTDSVKKDFDRYFELLDQGEKIGAVGGDPIFDGLQGVEFSRPQNDTIKQLTEFLQYNEASWYNSVGVQANYNMKRESINESESGMNVDSLLPFSDSMLESRKDACLKAKEILGLDLKVEFDSAWKKVRDESKEEPQNETQNQNKEQEVKEDGNAGESD